MTAPTLTTKAGAYHLEWEPEGINIRIDRVDNGSKATTGEVVIRYRTPGNTDFEHLHQARLNLTSTRERNTLGKYLTERVSEIDWNGILEQACYRALECHRKGSPIQEIWPDKADTLVPDYLVEPVLYKNHPNVIFGDYGSLKSAIALVIGYVVQLPLIDNELGLTTQPESTRCLFLDYEDDPSSFRKRWSALDNGFGNTAMPMQYLHMTNTLADSVDRLQKDIEGQKIGLVIVDSLGPAARGNLNDPEPAIRYHAALRELGVTSLTLAHCSKDALAKKRTIFGSVFFTNLARSVWEVRSEDETGEDEVVVSLKHQKANLSKKHMPMGFRFTFTDNSITVNKADLTETTLSTELPLSVRIKNLLRRGPMTIKALAEALEANEASVRTAINRLYKKQEVVKVGEAWGLASIAPAIREGSRNCE